MTAADGENLEMRVLVLAPTVKDGELTRAILARAGIACVGCSDQVQVCEQLTAGAGAVLIAEEAVHGGGLAEWLGRQPPWSDLPVLILAHAGANSVAVARAMEEFGNVTVLERPARIAALVSVVRTALRARQRQYQLRAQLAERQRFAEQLEMAMAAANAGSWQINLTTGKFSASDRAIELHGLPPGTHLNHERALACIHPDDRASIEAALRLTFETGMPFQHEHRVPQPDGSVRWVASRAERRGEGGETCVIGLVQDVTDRKLAEQARHEVERNYRTLAVASSEVAYRMTADWSTMLPLDGRQLVASSDQPLTDWAWLDQNLPRDEHPRVRQAISEAIARKTLFELEHRVRRPDGSIGWTFSRAVPVLDENGAVTAWFGAASDITDRKQADDALRASELRLRLSLEAAATGLWDWDVATNVVTWSPECYPIHGLKEGEFDGTAAGFDQLVHPDDRSRVWATVRAALDGQSKYECEFRIVLPNGEVRWVAHTGRATIDDGRPVSMIGVLTDITDRKRAQAERESEQMTLATLVERCPFGIYIVDDEFRMVHVNTASADVAFVNVRPLIGRPFDEVVRIIWPEPVAADCINIFRHTLATGEPYCSKDFVNLRADSGQIEGYEWEVHRINLASGRHGVVCYFFDATKLRQAENAVRDGEQRMRLATEATQVGIWQWNVLTGEILWDAQMFRIYGVPPTPNGCVQFDTWRGAVLPEDLPRQEEVLQETLRSHGSSNREFRIRRASDGECRVVEAMETVRTDAHGQVEWVVGTNLDITDRKREEALLKASETRYRRLFESAKDGILILDAHDATITDANPFMAEMLGYTQDEFVGKELWQIGLFQDVGASKAAMQELQEKGYIRYEDLPLETKAGRRINVEFISNVYGEDGEAVIQCNIRDISDRKRLEESLRQHATQLTEADRRKDEFLATLAHELRNPLSPIRNGLQIMKRAGRDAGAVEKTRSMMERQVAQMTHLIDDLMDVSRINQGKVQLQKARMNLAGAVQNAVDTCRPLIDAQGHELVVTVPSEPVYVDGDLTRLSQVFTNLLNNAAKYTDKGGCIRLAVERQGSEAVISVADNGVGILADKLTHVFDMFAQIDRSLEKSQGGLGVGLNIVRRLVELHDGSIVAESDGHGAGSRFIVRLPVPLALATDQPEGPHGVQTGEPARRRILVVDDNQDGAISLAEVLELMGNDTQTAYDGVEALAVAEAFQPDVILMDIGMPRLNGHDACRRIRTEPWGQSIILVAQTGWGQEDDKRKSKEAGFDFHLVKPVDPAALERLLAGLPVLPVRPG